VPNDARADSKDSAIDFGTETIDSATESGDSTSDGDTTSIFEVEPPPDTTPPDTTPPDGCGIPTGTTASASGSYMSTPDLAIDGDPGTYWNSGGYTGWLLLTFPKAQTIDSVTIKAVASPDTSETYTIYGTKSGAESVIATATLAVSGGSTVLGPIAVTKDSYDAIKIDVGGSLSWIAIADVTMHKIGCP